MPAGTRLKGDTLKLETYIKYSISTCLWRISTVCTAFMHKDLENMQKHHTFAPSKTKLTNEYKSDTYRHKVAVAWTYMQRLSHRTHTLVQWISMRYSRFWRHNKDYITKVSNLIITYICLLLSDLCWQGSLWDTCSEILPFCKRLKRPFRLLFFFCCSCLESQSVQMN